MSLDYLELLVERDSSLVLFYHPETMVRTLSEPDSGGTRTLGGLRRCGGIHRTDVAVQQSRGGGGPQLGAETRQKDVADRGRGVHGGRWLRRLIGQHARRIRTPPPVSGLFPRFLVGSPREGRRMTSGRACAKKVKTYA